MVPAGHLFVSATLDCGLVVRNTVATRQEPAHDIDDVARREVGIRAEIRPEGRLDTEDDAVRANRRLDVHRVVARMVARGEVLHSILDPLDRPPQVYRHGGDRDVLPVKGNLLTERAAHIRRDNPDLVLPEPQAGREPRSGDMSRLLTRVEGERASPLVPVGYHSTWLDRNMGQTRRAKLRLNNPVCLGECTRDIPIDLRLMRVEVVREIRIHRVLGCGLG